MGNMNEQQIRSEMTRLEEALVNLIGKKPAYMRPPYLQTSGVFLPTMRAMGYKVITNDVDSGDWNNQSPQQSQQAFQRAGTSGPGHIPLMHETYASTVNTLTPWLINWANQNGLKLVTVGMYILPDTTTFIGKHKLTRYVAECLNDAEGMYQPGNFTGNGRNYC
jgi:peptidoglycan/xylan/chitin deacetylase (PgdA/CDA1 family)